MAVLRFWRIFWIDASSNETATQSFRDIATGDPEAQTSGVEMSLQSILQWISRVDHEWLLVFDNADGEPDMVDKFTPPGNRGNLLITSRNPDMRRNVPSGDWAMVDEMEEEDAISLLLKAAFLDQFSDELRYASRSIVTELCFLPLAVDQAGAAIASGLCDIHSYLQMYTKHRLELLDDPSFKGASKYGCAVYGTWDLSFTATKARTTTMGYNLMDAQAAESAILILQTFAFLHHENIMEAIFEKAAEAWEESGYSNSESGHSSQMTPSLSCQLLQLDREGTWDAFFFRRGIQVLLSFSLVKRGTAGNVYSVHPLVHSWSRDRMSKPDCQSMCHSASALLSCSIIFQFTTKDYAFRQTLVPHINANYQHAAEAGVVKVYNNDEYTKFGLVYHESGYWQDAEQLNVQVMDTNLRVLGTEHPSTLTSMGNLASTYQNQGRWKAAEELKVQVMETEKRVLGAEHPSTLTSMQNLASTYSDQGKWKEAEELEIQVMETSLRVLGAEHPDILTSMGNLASTYQDQGRWKEAEELEIQVMETRKRVLGPEHPSTLTSMGNLASTYREQGRLKDAEELEFQVMETSLRVLGPEHPDTLTTMGNLALTYSNQGKWKEAEELKVQVMETSLRVLGAEHPDTLPSMGNLASTYWEQGRWKEAEELEIQVMETKKRVLGAEHPSTLTTMGNLASTYCNQGRWKEAEELEIQVMETRKRVLGAEHPSTLISMGNLASTYRNQGRWKEAEELEVQVMETSLRVLGAEHPLTLASVAVLVSTYQDQGRWEEAEELEVQVLVLGAEYPSTLYSLESQACAESNDEAMDLMP